MTLKARLVSARSYRSAVQRSIGGVVFGRFSVRALGINFITIPAPLVTHQSYLAFQQAIHANGLDYVRAENPENRILVKRDTPSPLHITVNLLDQQVGQFLVVAPNPKTSLNLFIQEWKPL